MAGASRMDTDPGSSSSSTTESDHGTSDPPQPTHPLVELVDYSLSLYTLPNKENDMETYHLSLFSVLTMLSTDKYLPQELQTFLVDYYTSFPNPAPTAYVPAGSTQLHSSANTIGNTTAPLHSSVPAPMAHLHPQQPVQLDLDALLSPPHWEYL
eukprot:9123308-Ditylum_brightwellii.AAC.1